MKDPEERPESPFRFHHGRLSLSFVGTVGDRGSLKTERLRSPADLEAWLTAAGLKTGGSAPPLAVYRRGLELREAIARTVGAIVSGARPASEDIAFINDIARRWAPRVSLEFPTLKLVRTGGDPIRTSLGQLAVDAIELLGNSELRAQLRACALDSCGATFLTPAGRRERRWCSMARCGNRAKVTAFRGRAANL